MPHKGHPAAKANLICRRVEASPEGHICGHYVTGEHMIFQCEWAQRVWFRTLDVRVDQSTTNSIEEWLTERRNESGNNWMVLERKWVICAFTCWMIWKERSKANFENKASKPNRSQDKGGKRLDIIHHRMQPRTRLITPR